MFIGKLFFELVFRLSMFLDSKYNLYIYNNIQNFTIISYLGCKKIDLNDCFGRNLAIRFLGDKRPQNEIFQFLRQIDAQNISFFDKITVT